MSGESDYDDNNIFAKIIRGEIPCFKIFETDHALAFLDAFPVCKGHSLLIPKALGYKTIADMPADEAANFMRELPRLCKAVQEATGATGTNVMQNNGSGAGQLVPHPHFHVVPRTEGDELFKYPESAKEMISPDVATPLADEIKAKLA